jgi:hypothetical protein
LREKKKKRRQGGRERRREEGEGENRFGQGGEIY